ncbi:hypothetical protein [Lactococcus lactis]|uniref:hypothetical protein n=1 Tax=Lactococcus lactis TaxID=1358 RepID=UPI000715850A|nr:hypothetical protein [Lactococcus lactis]KRO22042.1 hypothetical protein IV65_GL000997 [Lactococcus lactis subsp. lactis]
MKKFIKISIPVIPYFCYTDNSENKGENIMDINDPIIVQLGVRLAEVTAKNTASAVFGKIKAVKSEHDKDKVIAEMQDLVHELLDEKQELELIAKSYEEELVTQKLKKSDLDFVVQTVLPAIKNFMGKASGDEEEFKNNIKSIEALEPLLSLDTLMVLQTLGFNYKKGIGEPLTNLTSNLINKVQNNNQNRLMELNAEREIEYFKLLQDSEAFERFKAMSGISE